MGAPCVLPLWRWLTRHGRAAYARRDTAELLCATALCALLEGWWRLRASDAMTATAARLTLGLMAVAPLALAGAAASVIKAHAARWRPRRADLALYRVLGGDMRRAAARHALAAGLPPLAAAAGGLLAAQALLPTAPAWPAFPLTALGALAAATGLAAHAAWRTWQVPAAYDLADDACHDSYAGRCGDEFTDASGDHYDPNGAAVGPRLRALHAASPLLARRKPHRVGRYQSLFNPLLLMVYVLMSDKHASHTDALLARTGEPNDTHNDTDGRHHGPGPREAADAGQARSHADRTADPAHVLPWPDADAAPPHAGRQIETADATPPPPPGRAAAPAPTPLAELDHALLLTPAHGAPPHAADGAMAGVAGAAGSAHAVVDAPPHSAAPSISVASLATLSWSTINIIVVGESGGLPQYSATPLDGSGLPTTGVLQLGSLAALTQTPLNSAGGAIAAVSTSPLQTSLLQTSPLQTSVPLAAAGIGTLPDHVETLLVAAVPIDTSAVHGGAGSDLQPSAVVVIIGQPLYGHAGSQHI